MSELRNTLSKKERISGKKDISFLLAKGRFGNVPGIRYCYLKGTGQPLNRVMVSVSKKFFKRAVKRNLLKRRLRESFRLQKQFLPPEGGTDILLIYNTKGILPFKDIYSSVGQVLSAVSGSKPSAPDHMKTESDGQQTS